MNKLTADHFTKYFQEVHDVAPYPWQVRLTRQVLSESCWPDVIDLPTGTGKTAVLDTAVFALAARPQVFPRRIVFVIDRRIVVDQVYERAKRISKAITDSTGGVLAILKSRLATITEAEPLGVAALRGGVPIDGEWVRRPEQPWVVVSTVDQYGSRLLFRGYGVSNRMRPVHAGLAGNDCLVILDEVHLSVPFAQTLSDVTSDSTIPMLRSMNTELLPRRYQVVEMSATPSRDDGKRFGLLPSDLEESSLLQQIVRGDKEAIPVEVKGTRPPHISVPKRVLQLVTKETSDHEQSIGVIVNRVRTAREVHSLLKAKGLDSHLVTGRMRPIDRERVLRDIEKAVDPNRAHSLGERTVVVATQAIEVGADFSFDALISEASPVDSLRQRLGRLDRRGCLAYAYRRPARCWVLGVKATMNPRKPDPVYGDAARITWEWLEEVAARTPPPQDALLQEAANSRSEYANWLDVSLSSSLFEAVPEGGQAPQAEAPLLLTSHIDSWVQTNPEPVVQPSIADFLHGKQQAHEPDVSLAWRWDRSEQALKLVRPRPAELMSVPISAVRAWLGKGLEVQIADLDTSSLEDSKRLRPRRDIEHGIAVRWTARSGGKVEELISVDQIRPGDVIVVDPGLGGVIDGNWNPTASIDTAGRSDSGDADEPPVPVEDLGDAAQQAYKARRTMRLDHRLFDKNDLALVGKPPEPSEEEVAEVSRQERVRDWLSSLASLPAQEKRMPAWQSKLVDCFVSMGSFEIHLLSGSEPAYYVLVERTVDPLLLDGSDDTNSVTGAAVMLSEHLRGVGAQAAEFCRLLSLPEHIARDLRLAGELHDLGKVDSRFQDQMVGHDPVKRAVTSEPLAKSLPGIRTRAGAWPRLRHEFGSIAMAASSPEVLRLAHDPDLVLHLVGTHHGWARPLPPIVEDEKPQLLEYRCNGVEMRASSDQAHTGLALEMADRFWRLHKTYGHHGLAWLEAIFRLADQQRSAEEARRAIGQGKQPGRT